MINPQNSNEVKAFCQKYEPQFEHYGFPKSQLDKLYTYLFRLWSKNQELNLISRKMSFEDLIENHLFDCLIALIDLDTKANTVADFGTGGGLPGIIFAIARPEQSFYLYEKSNLKRQFLNELKDIAPNIECYESIDANLKVDLITARAFKPIEVIVELSRKYFEAGGAYYLLKARPESIQEEIANTRPKLKASDYRIKKLQHPLLDLQRNLVFIKRN